MTVKSSSFLRFWDLWGVKAAHKHIDEIDPPALMKDDAVRGDDDVGIKL